MKFKITCTIFSFIFIIISKCTAHNSESEEDDHPLLTHSLESEGTISNLNAKSGETYEVFQLTGKTPMYIDRRYKFLSEIPAILDREIIIRPANDDKFSPTSDGEFLTFEIDQDAEIFILYTNVNTTLEADWLNEENGWMLMPETVPTQLFNDEANRLVRKKGFPAGKVQLPGEWQHLQAQ